MINYIMSQSTESCSSLAQALPAPLGAIIIITTTISMYGCMYVCMYVRTYVRTYVLMYVFIYIYIYICMYVCVYIYIYIHMYKSLSLYIYIYIHTYMYMYVYSWLAQALPGLPSGPSATGPPPPAACRQEARLIVIYYCIMILCPYAYYSNIIMVQCCYTSFRLYCMIRDAAGKPGRGSDGGLKPRQHRHPHGGARVP